MHVVVWGVWSIAVVQWGSDSGKGGHEPATQWAAEAHPGGTLSEMMGDTHLGMILIEEQGSWSLYRPTLQKHWMSVFLSGAHTQSTTLCCWMKRALRYREVDLTDRN